MTIKIFVHWEAQEIYHTNEELVSGYLEYCCEENEFRSWLDENYTSDEIFAMTESQKEEVEESYREYLLQSAHYWAYDNNMEQEINI